MSRPMTIVHSLEKNRLTTGSVVQMMEAARGLAALGHHLIVAAPPGGDIEQACGAVGVPHLSIPLAGYFDPRSTLSLRRYLKHSRADVVHTHKGRAHSVALFAAAGLGRRPVLVVNRGVTFPLDRFNRLKYRHPRVAAVVCVSQAVAAVVARTGRVRPARLHVIHAGTDVSRFDPDRVDGAAVRRELGIPPDADVVGQVSVRDWKGWRELVDAFGRLAPTRPKTRLLLIACEPALARDAVVGVVSSAGLDDRVHLVGYRRDMPEVLAACDIVADASWAGTGITGTIREAMALGRPVIASDCGGNSELVTDGDCGLLFPPRDFRALTAALSRLLNDPDLRARLGAAARQRVLTGFTTDHRVSRLEALYRELLGS